MAALRIGTTSTVHRCQKCRASHEFAITDVETSIGMKLRLRFRNILHEDIGQNLSLLPGIAANTPGIVH